MPDLPKPAQPWTDPVQRIADLEQQVDVLERQLAAFDAIDAGVLSEAADELADIDTLTADVFRDDVPLRDRAAVLVADWNDTTKSLQPDWAGAIADARPWSAFKRLVNRRGVA